MDSEENRRSRLRIAISERADLVVADYVVALQKIGSPLVRPLLMDGVVDQARSILRNFGQVGWATAGDPGGGIGYASAPARVFPADAIHAANALFKASLPWVRDVLAEHDAPGEFAEILIELHEAIHIQAAVAVDRRPGYSSPQPCGMNSERRRMARELHDSVSHSIAVGLQQLDLRAIDLSDGDTVGADERLGKLRASLTDALDSIRELVGGLRHSPTRDGLAVALRDYVDALADQGAEVHLHLEGDIDAIPCLIRDELYFVAREAMRNAVAHSRSARIVVEVAVSDGFFEAVVEDFGGGFDVGRPEGHGTGSGLASMRERMEILDGWLKIVSAPGLGTRVVASVRL